MAKAAKESEGPTRGIAARDVPSSQYPPDHQVIKQSVYDAKADARSLGIAAIELAKVGILTIFLTILLTVLFIILLTILPTLPLQGKPPMPAPGRGRPARGAAGRRPPSTRSSPRCGAGRGRGRNCTPSLQLARSTGPPAAATPTPWRS